ncbi:MULTISPECIES: L-threonylcarbamoyladenylate synthase [Marichromatium]|uniref:tRNA threonylcarbamoyl adenosine modification protein (Sua5/YciO/YrdC/YwlC family) n=1 Tax=Marichromatium gracile TaxID=1048 RepID=A0A4V2W9C7_MARGR|nr:MULTISPECIES: L-threonylcarbamoyladenylate synthase [Marichromatium]MBK1709871.1 threonylcarbamoyl-AMP synthase [Marichromatium gracile]MBO8087467.1 threonylcarbamoyl-AMP synthase [Marichromatium sp.]RNE92877.1 threonylcarbamoyl-AMP synthase [Marichromatium sp. AB32]TCW34850.1 tRNA threonylcarbamoyl adenosine modification protein (Sua5/YciO/YrdC/YwlC family) [Marichromatium gracile]
MAQFFQIHPVNPQPRLIRRAVEILLEGGVIVYPTDSSYALGCQLGEKSAMERIRRIRRLDDKHNFTLVCRDLSEITTYAKIDNQAFRLLKSLTPGPYTFIHHATKQVPRRLLHPKRKAIGIRVPDNEICRALLGELDQPILSSTLIMPDDEHPLTDPYDMRELLDKHVDLVIDGDFCGLEPTTVIDMTAEPPEVVRQGKGEAAPLN